MTVKQERFIRELPTSKSATEAAIKAGYSPTSAPYHTTNMLNNVNIKAKLDEIKAKADATAEMNLQEIKHRLSEIARNGNVKQTNPVEAMKELSKLSGYYPPIQHQVASKVVFEVVYVDRRELPQPVVEGEFKELSEPTVEPV